MQLLRVGGTMKFLFRLESDRIKVYRIKKGPRQMVTVAGRLYRLDDDLMVKDVRCDQSAAFYNIDSTQPILPMLASRPVDPDITRAYIDSAKNAGSTKTIWASLSSGNMTKWMTPLIVAVALAYGFLM